jgi:signal transduction histidine kinase
VTRRSNSSQTEIKTTNSVYREVGNMEKHKNITEINSSVPDFYNDHHGLPVMYDNAKIKPKNETKTETNIISVLWHELISPLTIIKGYAATLLQLNDAITEEQKEQYLKGIDIASNRMIRLLENLRDITKLEETNTINLQKIFLPDLIKQMAIEIQNQTTKHFIKILPYARLPLIKVDPEKIEIVINNILGNAIKYSPQGGDITIEINAVHKVKALQKMFGNAPEISVPCLVTSISDTGIGIHEAEVEHVFEKFYRVKDNLTRSIPGAGLGLYICKIIIEGHGGRIWMRNRLHGGCSVHFSLPME